jgi:hypothetical protein
MSALRDQFITAARAPKLIPVQCPRLGGITVYVNGSMKVADRLEVARLSKADEDISVPLVILAARDELGDPLFTPEDAPALAEMDGLTLQAIAVEALRANGMASGSVEDARKN